MKIIILSTIGALILLGVGVYIVFQVSERVQTEDKSFFRIEARWLYGFLVYASVTVTIFLILVLQTSLTRQTRTLENTQARFQRELTAFRTRLGDQTDRLMSQIDEKAELTGSEIEMRGKLSNEIAHHQRTRQERDATRADLQTTQGELKRETRAHYAYRDSLNTERSLHATVRKQLAGRTKTACQKPRHLAKYPTKSRPRQRAAGYAKSATRSTAKRFQTRPGHCRQRAQNRRNSQTPPASIQRPATRIDDPSSHCGFALPQRI